MDTKCIYDLYIPLWVVYELEVRLNLDRFPESFGFRLTKREKDELVANCDRFPKDFMLVLSEKRNLPSGITICDTV